MYQTLNLEQPNEHPVLRKIAQKLSFPLSEDDLRDIQRVSRQFDQEGNMAGLAAPQIGIAKQIIVFWAPEDPLLKKWRRDFTQSMPKTIWLNCCALVKECGCCLRPWIPVIDGINQIFSKICELKRHITKLHAVRLGSQDLCSSFLRALPVNSSMVDPSS